MTSPIYSSPFLFDVAMRAKFGALYEERLRRVASEIEPGDRVVDLCAGDAMIFRRFLRGRNVDYTGYEINPRMVKKIRARGIRMIHADIRTLDIPPADVVLCLSSLYQFPDLADDLIRRARAVASRLVLLEPVDNMAMSRFRPLARLAAWITDFGEGPVGFRFSDELLRERFRLLGAARVDRIGAELMAV